MTTGSNARGGRADKSASARFATLADAGARQAAEAFGQLLGESVMARTAAFSRGDGLAGGSDDGPAAESGVFFELAGCLDAKIGIFLPAATGRRLVARLVGSDADAIDAATFESALTEVGNILASHVASAIADRLGGSLMPSIPSFASAEAALEFDDFLARSADPGAGRIESQLVLASGLACGRLVLVDCAFEGVGED